MPKRYDPHELVHLQPGAAVERDVLRIVEQVRAYDPNLDVQYLDPDRFPEHGDAPYRIVERCRDGWTRVVFSVWELDSRVLDRIHLADTASQDVLKRLDANNAAIKMEQNRRFREESLGEARDITKHILQNAKTSYKFHNTDGQLVTIEDDKGVTKRVG